MDVYCKICGEPWDTDTLHEEVAARKEVGHSSTYRGVWRDFGMRGCVALSTSMGTGPCSRPGRKADPRIAAIYDVLGDDVDGAAAELEDLLG